MRSVAPDKQGKRCSVGFRTTRILKARLDDASAASGRSLAQEMEVRLEQSMRDDDMRAAIREEVRAALREEGGTWIGPHTHSFLSTLGPPYEVTGEMPSYNDLQANLRAGHPTKRPD